MQSFQSLLLVAPQQYSMINEVVNEEFHDRELVSEHLMLEVHRYADVCGLLQVSRGGVIPALLGVSPCRVFAWN